MRAASGVVKRGGLAVLDLLRPARDARPLALEQVWGRVDLDALLELARNGVARVRVERVAAHRDEAPVRQQQGLGVVVAPHRRVRHPGQVARARVIDVAEQLVARVLPAVAARAAGDHDPVVRGDDHVRIANRLLEVRAGLEARVVLAQVDDVGACRRLVGLPDAAPAGDHVALVLGRRQQDAPARLGHARIAQTGHLLEAVVAQVPDAGVAPHGVRAVAGVAAGVEELAARHQEQRRVRREGPPQLGLVVPEPRLRVVHLVVAVDDATELVEPGDRQHAPALERYQRRIPAGQRHVVDALVALGLGVEQVRLLVSPVLLLGARQRRRDAVQVVARPPADRELRGPVHHRGVARVDGLDPHLGRACRDCRGAPLADHLRGRPDVDGPGSAERHSRGRDQLGALVEPLGTPVRRLVLDRHRAGSALDVLLQHLVALGPARDQQLPVRKEDVAGAEHVARRVDALELAGIRVPEQALELAGVELLPIVARPGDDQHLAGVQHRRVDRVDPQVLRHRHGRPEASALLVALAVDLVVVQGVAPRGHDRGPVDRDQAAGHGHG